MDTTKGEITGSIDTSV
ncbi:hypothetical protein, partial [Tropheryma whipplei]